ncbi:cation:proton antiporter domain-containing protein [Kutzneria sp. CA-103260]|uniref:cation:proton antiporter domain-containing protein n=1 Tax=Kutzneria sp. CA-103260 TaxID=2802641 RepID=UPI001BA5831C|nr:cation:proton antiporter [Kutzneria sp. CA-103260]QUQ64349.1 integral membrane ion antiporter [Kutzneria sp. CA-103260]
MSSHQIVGLFADLALIALLARALGMLARRFDQPAVVGEILAGILLGPTFVHGAISGALFPADVRPLLTALADVGVALFMFVVGLDFEPATLGGRRRVAVTVALGAMVLPFGLGCLLAVVLAPEHAHGQQLGFVLFLGAAMAVTAFPVLARIINDRHMSRTSVGGLALSAAALGDLLAWSLLAVVVMLVSGSGQTGWHLLLLVPYAVLMVAVVRPLVRRLVVARQGDGGLDHWVLVVMAGGALVSGALTEWMGLHFIFGAFFFGLLVPKDGLGRFRADLRARVEQLPSALLLPVYFVVAGLGVDLSHVDASMLTVFALILVAAVGGKLVGTFATARSCRIPPRQAAALATLMNTRGLTELVILTVGLQLGVLDGELYSLMVVMAVLTTVMTGPLLRLIYPLSRIAAETTADERRQPAHD